MKLLIFGLGYVGSRIGPWGTHRVPKPGALVFAEGTPLAPEALEGVTHILSTIPPDAAGDPVVRVHGKDLEKLSSLKWVGYLSSTSVYGDHDGRRVTEESACHPQTAAGKARLGAEKEWQSLDVPLHIFRLSGIYGPGRSVFERLRAPHVQKIMAPDHPFSRIHVEDIAALVSASMRAPHPGAIYNLADLEPAPTNALFDYATDLLGRQYLPETPLSEAQLSPQMADFYRDRKIVDGSKILECLGHSLLYPTYREGLTHCFSNAVPE